MHHIEWLDKNEYPFKPHYFTTPEGRMHYLDTGKGNVIFFVHGTPEWSFAYRNTIKKLSLQYRCIAVDHLGFGLSDKPSDADYSVEAHAKRLEKFIIEMQLQNITLVAGDFGGATAIHYALHNRQNVRQLILWNTWMWDLMPDKKFSGPANMVHSALGKFLYKYLNAPLNLIMPQAYADKKKLTRAIHRQYKMPFQKRNERVALYAIARQLKDAGSWWQQQWEMLDKINGLPVTFIWGMSDKFIQPYMLGKWKIAFPKATIVELNTGHFVAEESAAEFTGQIMTQMQNVK